MSQDDHDEVWADLGAAWRDEKTEPTPISAEEIAGRARAFASTMRWRNARELGAVALLVAFGAYRLWHEPLLFGKLAAASFIAVPLVVAVILVARGRNLTPPPPTATTEAFLRHERLQRERQIALLGSVRTWYLAPLTAPIALVCIATIESVRARGGDPWAPAALGSLALVIAVCAVVFTLVGWLNARAVRELEAQLSKLPGAEEG